MAEITVDMIIEALTKGFDKLSGDLKKVGDSSEESSKKTKALTIEQAALDARASALSAKMRSLGADVATGAKSAEQAKKEYADFEKNLESSGKKVDFLQGQFAKLVASGVLLAAGKALIDFGRASITAASDVEEMQSKFNTVFRDLAGPVTQELEQFAEAANRSKFDLMGFAATLQDTFVPLGFARDEAASMSVEIVKLAEDLASFNNLNTADVVADLQSALVGNTETLRKYGVVATQAAIDQKALEMGLQFTKGAMDGQTKAAAILALTMEGTVDAQGDAIKTADSYANQVKGMQAAVSELQVAIGTALLPVMTELVGLVTEAADRLSVAAGMAGEYNDQAEQIISANVESAKSFDELVTQANKIDEVGNMWGGLATAVTGTNAAFRDGIIGVSKELAGAADSFEDFEGVVAGWSARSRTAFNAYLAAQGLTIEEFYKQEQAAAIAARGFEEMADVAESADRVLLQYVDTTEYFIAATLGADAVLMQTVETYQANAAAAELLAEKQANAATTTDVLTAASEREAEQFMRLHESGYLAANGITAIIPAADGAGAAVDRANLHLDKLLGYMNSLDGRSVSASVTVTVDDASARLSDMAGGGDSGGGKGQTSGGSKSGSGYSNSGYDPSGPKYATGTDGWQMVPGGTGQPYPVTLHGGEAFNVIPANQVGKGGGAMGGVQINGPLIGQVVQRPGENGSAFADRVATMVTERVGSLR